MAEPLTRSLPASWHHDPAVWERERRAIFGRSWQYAGHAAQVASPGDYVVADVAGFPVLVLRGGDGVLRAFHNVCLHRAGPLVWDAAGHCANLVCRYHGWAYDLDGRLRSARDFGADVDEGTAGSLHLPAVRVDVWRGLVFVNLDADAPPLPQWLGTFAAVCEPFPMESFAWHSRVVHRVEANWKTYCDNYGEGYHIPTVHPGLNKEVDAKRYRVHVHDGGRTMVHEAPARDGAPTTGRWLFRFPNLALNLYPHGMNVERFVPRGPRAVDVVFEYFFADTSPAAEQANAASIASSAEIMAEDLAICEAVQRNLEAGVYESGVLSPRHEQGLLAVQALVREALAEG